MQFIQCQCSAAVWRLHVVLSVRYWCLDALLETRVHDSLPLRNQWLTSAHKHVRHPKSALEVELFLYFKALNLTRIKLHFKLLLVVMMTMKAEMKSISSRFLNRCACLFYWLMRRKWGVLLLMITTLCIATVMSSVRCALCSEVMLVGSLVYCYKNGDTGSQSNCVQTWAF